jgi:tripartite-type tricarboxylate transporter receptor subunit TctC
VKNFLRLIACVLAVASATAVAQGTYPDKPIRFIVPFSPGGSADFLARTIGGKLGAALGQTVVVENKPGAGGILGADVVAKSDPDGYTMLFANTNIAINPSLYKMLPYDTAAVFAPVIHLVSVPNLLLVAGNVPVNDLKGLIALAKEKPGSLNFASAGNGTFPHLAIELFKAQAGVKMTHVPYKGAAPALNALLRNEVQVLSNDLLSSVQYVKTGKLKALAITSAERSPVMPDVPTVSEAGVKGYAAVGWQGVMVRSGAPAAIVSRLNAEINKVLKDPAVRDMLSSRGMQVIGGSADAFGTFVREDTERWKAAVAASGAKIE